MIDGGWTWLQDSHGLLTRPERAALLGRLPRLHVENAIGRIRLLTHRPPANLARLDVAQVTPPDSRWAREAEATAAGQPPPLLGHAYRSWAYGVALAHLDRVRPDL